MEAEPASPARGRRAGCVGGRQRRGHELKKKEKRPRAASWEFDGNIAGSCWFYWFGWLLVWLDGLILLTAVPYAYHSWVNTFQISWIGFRHGNFFLSLLYLAPPLPPNPLPPLRVEIDLSMSGSEVGRVCDER